MVINYLNYYNKIYCKQNFTKSPIGEQLEHGVSNQVFSAIIPLGNFQVVLQWKKLD